MRRFKQLTESSTDVFECMQAVFHPSTSLIKTFAIVLFHIVLDVQAVLPTLVPALWLRTLAPLKRPEMLSARCYRVSSEPFTLGQPT